MARRWRLLRDRLGSVESAAGRAGGGACYVEACERLRWRGGVPRGHGEGVGYPPVDSFQKPGIQSWYGVNTSPFHPRTKFQNTRTMTKPRAKRPKSTGTADSIRQAAATLRIPLDTLREAKAAGCPAFRGGRVRLHEFTAWIADPANSELMKERLSDIDAVNLDIARERLRILRIKADSQERVLIPAAEVKRTVQQAVFGFKRKILALPRRMAQRVMCETDPIQVEQILYDECWDALDELSKGEWAAPGEESTPPPVRISEK